MKIDWNVVDKEWSKAGDFPLDRAAWFLLGIHPPVNGKYKKIHDEKDGDFDSLREVLKGKGICTYEKKYKTSYLEVIRSTTFGIDDPSTYEKIYYVSKEKLIKFYENRKDLGRPPFLFEDARPSLDQKKEANGNSKLDVLHPRKENSYLRLIAAMENLLLANKRYTNQKELIEELVSGWGDNDGISETQLQKTFPKAKQVLENPN